MAGYNNYFPQSYMNTMYGYSGGAAPVQTTSPSMAAQGQPGAINWVQGEAGARSVPVAAGQKILLMDSENNVFYVKSSDPSGMPLPLRTFEYKEVVDVVEETAPAQSEYVTHEELKQILEDLKPTQKEEKQNEFLI